MCLEYIPYLALKESVSEKAKISLYQTSDNKMCYLQEIQCLGFWFQLLLQYNYLIVYVVIKIKFLFHMCPFIYVPNHVTTMICVQKTVIFNKNISF